MSSSDWRVRRQRALFHRSFNASHRKTLRSLPSLVSSKGQGPDVFSLSLDGRLGNHDSMWSAKVTLMYIYLRTHPEILGQNCAMRAHFR